MKIKRYEIVKYEDSFRVIDKLEGGFVKLTLTCDTKEMLEGIMGKDMEEEVDYYEVNPSNLSQPGEIKDKPCKWCGSTLPHDVECC